MSLAEAFEAAREKVNNLTKRPTNEELLKLYGLYKQGTEGDVTIERPGGFDFKGAAKWDAWKALEGTPAAESQQAYIDLVDSLLAKYANE